MATRLFLGTGLLMGCAFVAIALLSDEQHFLWLTFAGVSFLISLSAIFIRDL
jgi:hypothetical protein